MAGRFSRLIDRTHLATSLYDIGATLGHHWPLIVSGAIAAATGAWGWWAWATQWGYLPVFVASLVALAASMSVFRTIVLIKRQDRPSKARSAFDYSYGLAIDEIIPSHDARNDQNSLEFRFHIRNVSPGPLKYNAERIDAIIGDRIKTLRDISGALPRSSWIQLKVGGFNKQTVDELPDRISGRYELSINYGHPEEPYSWQMKKLIIFDLVKQDGKVTGAPWNIVSENDSPIRS
jgi:hypothetical protein